ncbi:hypothetical protein [Pararhizobium sp.]|uniref:hypothetical protein n=1 Tax=Pararhizobium sp. TaxID=1977563 RepID=UPI00271951F8|nr:hypothetical protein [Pararhizobium sp.]MDO9416999.1 hypothetical protein [Pararhizobium sp.]
MNRVFTAEYCEGQYALIAKEQVHAKLFLEIATLKALSSRVLEAGGGALHNLFVAGEEPKWADESQRAQLIELSDCLEALHEKITKGDAQ